MPEQVKTSNNLVKNFSNFFEKHKKTILIVTFCFGLITASYPFWPEIGFLINKWLHPEVFEDSKKKNDKVLGITEEYSNSLEIPSIGLKKPYFSGTSESLLRAGIWMKPISVELGSVGNKVLTGHKFGGLANIEGPFYHLYKVKVGDNVYISKDDVSFEYVVTKTFRVKPDEVWVEEPSEKDILTIYTCTDVDAKARFVVVAERKQNL